MSTVWFLRNTTDGEVTTFVIGPHAEVPDGWESIDSGLEAANGIPDWVGYSVWEGGRLREMTPEEKTLKEADMETLERTREFSTNRALHAAFKVFLEEINSLRQAEGLAPLDAAEIRGRIEQEYLAQ